ncbi:MAG: nicotinamide-nucleotide amidase [Porticoccaceae bacterium]|jgi:nicotinamide-nucleotide amidase|nr:nicotinamide-nucleotide amidase [Porticoccaceae bacterium]
MNKAIAQLASDLGAALLSRAWQVTCAESCTGGGVAAAITAIPGSSSWFGAGFVTYSNNHKQTMLGVKEATLAQFGAVSEEVVREMAQGALLAAAADIAVAVSGIAGPDGGTPSKPVGTVWFCWALADGSCHTMRRGFAGDRSQVREQAVVAALEGLVHYTKNTV